MRATINIHASTPEELKKRLKEEHHMLTIHLPKGVKPSPSQFRSIRSFIDGVISLVLGCSNVSIFSKGSVLPEGPESHSYFRALKDIAEGDGNLFQCQQIARAALGLRPRVCGNCRHFTPTKNWYSTCVIKNDIVSCDTRECLCVPSEWVDRDGE